MSAKPMQQNGRFFTTDEVAYIEQVVRQFPNLPRNELADTICEHLEWFTASGGCKSQACLALLKRLEEKKRIILPPPREPFTRATVPPPFTMRTESKPEINCELKNLGEIILIPAPDTMQRKLVNEYIERYHYLGYKQPFGNCLKYLIYAGETVVGCMIIAGAAKRIVARDEWIGWNTKMRMTNLPWVINNTRFLIFPWVKVPHLASHVLGKLARQIREDCLKHWRYAPLVLETFVDPVHYQGTCYKAANWIYLGETTGQGHYRRGKTYQSTPKMIFGSSEESVGQFRPFGPLLVYMAEKLSEAVSIEYIQ